MSRSEVQLSHIYKTPEHIGTSRGLPTSAFSSNEWRMQSKNIITSFKIFVQKNWAMLQLSQNEANLQTS